MHEHEKPDKKTERNHSSTLNEQSIEQTPAAVAQWSPAGILRLQRLIGNRAVTELLQRDPASEPSQEEYSRAVAALGAASAIAYTKYADAVKSVEGDLRAAAKEGLGPVMFIKNLVGKVIEVPAKLAAVAEIAAGAGKAFLHIELPDVEEALVNAATKEDIGFVERLLEVKDSAVTAIVRSAPLPNESTPRRDCIAAIDQMTNGLNKVEKVHYKEEIKAELARYQTNVLAVGEGYMPDDGKGHPEDWIEIHWVDVSGSGNPTKTYLAQVAFHNSTMGPSGCWQWKYHFVRWVAPDYALEAMAAAQDTQKENYVDILHQVTPFITFKGDAPFVSNYYIGPWGSGMNGKKLEEALGEDVDAVDREHELEGVDSPALGSVYSKHRWAYSNP